MNNNKSIRYLKIKNETFKIIKHFDNTIDSFKLKDNAKKQNCWTIKDYEFFKSYATIKDCKKELKELY